MATNEIRRAQLSRLIEVLRDLTGVMILDPSCAWTRHFRSLLMWSESLQNEDFVQEDLTRLSISITRSYEAGFSDYSPGYFDSFSGDYIGIAGTENFETFSKVTRGRAVALRAVDQI